MPNDYINHICSIQRALLRNVTPNLRAVYVLIHNVDEFDLIFYYSDLPSEEEEELASLVDTEVLADFPSCESNFIVKSIKFPEKIPDVGICVYLRYEGFDSNY